MASTITAQKPGKKLISYRYEAVDQQGRLIKGTLKAAGEIEAERILIQRGYRPINVEITPSMFSLEEALPSLFQVKPRDVILFSRQLATLLRSGISLLPALEILGEQATTGRAFRKILASLVDELRSGGAFTQALSKYPKVFSEIYVKTIAVGEQSGSLEMVLNQMADYLEKQGALAKKVSSALTYPIMVIGIGIVVVGILMVVVMPQMIDVFSAMDVALPLPTRILIAISNFVSTNPLYLLIAGSVLAAVAIWMVKQPTGRRLLDHLKLKTPLVGPPILLSELARLSRTTSVLIAAGLNLQEIMSILPQSTSNRFIQEALNQVSEGLLLGEGLAEPMSRIEIFPPLMVQMVNVGEESNTLDFTMGVVADFYETTSEEKMATMVGMIGPISTIAIAGLVGMIAISVIMPMYALTGSF
jgi:type IV pilus assembly protein PilC